MLQFKKTLVRKAYEQGKYLDPQDVTDDAVFRLVRDDATIRDLVLSYVEGYFNLRRERSQDIKRLQEIGKNYQPKSPYPNTPLANRLKLAAQLIDADLGARIFYVSIDGFDTHANQLQVHGNLLRQLAEGLVRGAQRVVRREQRGGNARVILCERGIRTFETATRNTLDLSAVPAAQARWSARPSGSLC